MTDDERMDAAFMEMYRRATALNATPDGSPERLRDIADQARRLGPTGIYPYIALQCDAAAERMDRTGP